VLRSCSSATTPTQALCSFLSYNSSHILEGNPAFGNTVGVSVLRLAATTIENNVAVVEARRKWYIKSFDAVRTIQQDLSRE